MHADAESVRVALRNFRLRFGPICAEMVPMVSFEARPVAGMVSSIHRQVRALSVCSTDG